MRAGVRAALLAAPLVGGASAALAQDDAQMCRNGLFATNETQIGRAQVIGQGKLILLDDGPGCPAETAKCRADTTSVVPGATLLTGHRLAAFTCALDPVSGNAGYVETSRLKALTVDASPALKTWAGTWRQFDDSIRLTVTGSGLAAKGEAYWPSAHPSPKQYPGGPNTGDLTGMAVPKGNVVTFADSSDPQACSATLTLIGDALVVADNQNCGGMNVSFTGVYRRK